jgi:DNA-binding GntR family transcriptional regulator
MFGGMSGTGAGTDGGREAVPPWLRVSADLRRRIEAGEWPPGAMLPTLDELAREYHVSRTTARKALGALGDVVESYRGWGSFVRRD